MKVVLLVFAASISFSVGQAADCHIKSIPKDSMKMAEILAAIQAWKKIPTESTSAPIIEQKPEPATEPTRRLARDYRPAEPSPDATSFEKPKEPQRIAKPPETVKALIDRCQMGEEFVIVKGKVISKCKSCDGWGKLKAVIIGGDRRPCPACDASGKVELPQIVRVVW